MTVFNTRHIHKAYNTLPLLYIAMYVTYKGEIMYPLHIQVTYMTYYTTSKMIVCTVLVVDWHLYVAHIMMWLLYTHSCSCN